MKIIPLLFGTVLLGASSLVAAPIVGFNSAGSCYPFACFVLNGGSVYQEVYDASQFPEPITINTLSFFRRPPIIEDPSILEQMDDAIYTVTLSTTSAGVLGLSTTLAENLGSDAATFGIFHISGKVPNIMTLQGTPFLYDPADGNLLMQVEVTSVIAAVSDHNGGFQADRFAGVVSASFRAKESLDNTGGALVTEFNATDTGTVFTGIAAVPEPGSVVQLGLGLAGISTLLWRRRRG